MKFVGGLLIRMSGQERMAGRTGGRRKSESLIPITFEAYPLRHAPNDFLDRS